MSRQTVVVADDLTSATEVASRMGSAADPALVLFDPSAGPPSRLAGRTCVVTQSRGLSATAAASVVRRCLESYVAAEQPPVTVVKTMDSSLRGNWAVELAAVVNVVRARVAIVAPAFPEQGRVTRHGLQIADGLLVHEGPAAQDPRSPVTSSRIAAHLETVGLLALELPRPSLDGGRRLTREVEAARPTTVAIVVDVEDDDDLQMIANLASEPDVVWCAGPGLARALVSVARPVVADAMPSLPAALCVVGSLHPHTRRQVLEARSQGVPVVHATDVPGASRVVGEVVTALRDQGRAVLCSPSSPIDRPDDLLATITRAVLLRQPQTGLVLSGGDTALAVALGLGAASMTVGGECSPGAPWGRLDDDGRTVVVTKAGGFGDGDAITSLLSALAPASRPLAASRPRRLS